MKIKYLLILFLLGFSKEISAQNLVPLVVGGDANKYYPVSFYDVNWYLNKETVIGIGRSSIHQDSIWRGSMISKFSYHVSNYGHLSGFINAEIHSSDSFIGGWADVSAYNASHSILVWLKGGGNTYYLTSDKPVDFVVYDGQQNPLPFQEHNGPVHTFKTVVDDYVSNYRTVSHSSAAFMGPGNNYFYGNVGIGTFSPNAKLAVNGNIRAREIKVETATWPDFVFLEDYKHMSLAELEAFINKNKHLPEMPTAKEVEKDGIALGEMNRKLLQKVEELTLHLIAKDKQIQSLENRVNNLEQKR